MKTIEAAGGKVVTPKVEMMGMGFYAYIADPDGNVRVVGGCEEEVRVVFRPNFSVGCRGQN